MDQDLHCLTEVICLMAQIRRSFCAVLAVDLGPVTVTVSYTDKQTAGISIRLLVHFRRWRLAEKPVGPGRMSFILIINRFHGGRIKINRLEAEVRDPLQLSRRVAFWGKMLR